MTQPTGAARSRAAGGRGAGEQRARAAAAVAEARRPLHPREPGEPAAESRRQPQHHVPRQQAEKALAGGERYCRCRRPPLAGPPHPGTGSRRGLRSLRRCGRLLRAGGRAGCAGGAVRARSRRSFSPPLGPRGAG